MTLYEVKMYLKRLSIVKLLLDLRVKKESKQKAICLEVSGIELMESVEKALSDTNIRYFADYGTLLGIVRDGNFIGWDNDVDYGILIDEAFDWNAFENHMGKYGFKKVREFEFKGRIREQTYSKGYLTVDIFGHQNYDKKSTVYGFFRKENYIYKSSSEFHAQKVEYDLEIGESIEKEFLGKFVKIPRNAENYLEAAYGTGWKVPDPNWKDGDNVHKKIIVMTEVGHGYFYPNN